MPQGFVGHRMTWEGRRQRAGAGGVKGHAVSARAGRPPRAAGALSGGSPAPFRVAGGCAPDNSPTRLAVVRQGLEAIPAPSPSTIQGPQRPGPAAGDRRPAVAA
ncbi:hypothetical protein GCM10022205_13010 [Spinactinospora alkalitolerans]